MKIYLTILLSIVTLAACDKKGKPDPVIPDREASTYFGRMILLEHDGPRGQIHLSDGTVLWFPAVRDLMAYYLRPEEAHAMKALYVTDMSHQEDWNNPTRWSVAEDMLYVIGSSRRGGMGAAEAVPFSVREDAEQFIAEFGGRIVPFKDIDADYIFNRSLDKKSHKDGKMHMKNSE